MVKPWLMDLLICPARDCRGNLSIEIFEKHQENVGEESFEEIDEALITCQKCGRWYPVIDTIPCMLPDDLRLDGKQRIEETKFLEKWRSRIPSGILDEGIPFGLSSKE